MNELAFRIRDGVLNCVKLLSQLNAASAAFDHRDRRLEMTFGPLEPSDDVRMASVLHINMISPWIG